MIATFEPRLMLSLGGNQCFERKWSAQKKWTRFFSDERNQQVSTRIPRR